MTPDSGETARLVALAEQGHRSAIDRLMRRHRGYLKRLIGFRMDPELRNRIDASDVVQEAQLVAARRFDDFLRRRPSSFRLWLRHTAVQILIDQRRRHLARKRAMNRDVYLSDMSSQMIARRLFEGSPSKIVLRAELRDQIQAAMLQLNDIDREILFLRYVEELANAEVADVLQIDPAAASRRHGRAVRRLCECLVSMGVDLDRD